MIGQKLTNAKKNVANMVESTRKDDTMLPTLVVGPKMSSPIQSLHELVNYQLYHDEKDIRELEGDSTEDKEKEKSDANMMKECLEVVLSTLLSRKYKKVY